ncbi:agglutinin biogenesis protein MshP [Massilia sp. TWR1-2-2]|uniref:agglutinin biogenesis protein MshP n=1 Tax=Massilia sp. TWR1-2-2 TaxID=2804584 RepID=UPI003CF1CC24
MMRARSQIYRLVRRSAGVGIVTAIFLLVVLAALAVALVGISTAQNSASALDVQGARAYQAARAGVEWGLFQSLRNPAFVCNGNTSFALPASGSLRGFVVTVNCTSVAGAAGAAPGSPAAQPRSVLTATACNLQAAPAPCQNAGNNADYVERQVKVIL